MVSVDSKSLGKFTGKLVRPDSAKQPTYVGRNMRNLTQSHKGSTYSNASR